MSSAGCRELPGRAGPDYDWQLANSAHAGRRQTGDFAGQVAVIYISIRIARQELWQARLGIGGALGGISEVAADGRIFTSRTQMSRTGAQAWITALRIATGEKLWQVLAPPPNCSWERRVATLAIGGHEAIRVWFQGDRRATGLCD